MAQKLALEGTPLSGVYIVVKYGHADEIAELVTKIMSFIGNDDICIIVTWADIASKETRYNPNKTRMHLSQLLDVKIENIVVVGKDTSKESILSFIKSTLHNLRSFNITEEQVASISLLCISTQKINKAIDEVYAKIAAVSKACTELKALERTFSSDTAIVTIQQATSEMVKVSKERIFNKAYKMDLLDEQQNLIYRKAGFALSLHLKIFIESSNKFLSWDVTNMSDSHSVYKRCNFCGAIFNKTEGCDGATICGQVPRSINI